MPGCYALHVDSVDTHAHHQLKALPHWHHAAEKALARNHVQQAHWKGATWRLETHTAGEGKISPTQNPSLDASGVVAKQKGAKFENNWMIAYLLLQRS